MLFRSSYFWGFAVIMICGFGYGDVVLAKGCLTGSCHQEFAGFKHLHGPIAAELAGAQGCIMCHQPAGVDCTVQHGGKFNLTKEGLCLACHDKVTSTEHTKVQAEAKCLECHSPHGSDFSPHLLRKGK
ncbi:MAG: hypothetical protein OEY01_07400 [Desulfobulbaceae bacterium]|nr:hypothetical protein [Desulfobulbaceae bacterium]HIJ78879.1 hypothetical protein [Deltaproteobacteria bacterium]